MPKITKNHHKLGAKGQKKAIKKSEKVRKMKPLKMSPKLIKNDGLKLMKSSQNYGQNESLRIWTTAYKFGIYSLSTKT